MIAERHQSCCALLTALIVAGLSHIAMAANPPAASAPVDCDALDKLGVKDTAKAYPDAVTECVRRGWEPPPSWKVRGGENPGIRAGGSGGISNNTTASPDVTGKARNARASIKKDRIQFSCDFPPRIKFGLPPKLDIPKGSCWDFFASLLKDKTGATTTSPPAPGIDNSSKLCPAEADTTGVFGARRALTGGAIALSCGGAVPTTSVDMVLNANPSGLAVTEENSYYIWIYHKNGGVYSNVANAVKLPTYLCSPMQVGDGTTYQKSVDLTPPIAQMITFNAGMDHITIRLRPRESMDANFIPPYTDGEPEKYLIIPLDGAGNPTIPNNCSDEATYFDVPNSRRDIVVHSSTMAGCEGVSVTPAAYNDAKAVCPAGSNLNAQTGKCIDANGKAVPSVPKDDWKMTCPNKTQPVGGKCPEDSAIPTDAICSTLGYTANENCSTSIISVDMTGGGGACTGKTQYSVLNRPNLYYPPGSTPFFSRIEGRTALMADTVDGNKFLAQAQTTLYLRSTSPTITLGEGGMIRFPKNGPILIMEADAIINMAAKQITLTHGAQLTTAQGDQIRAYKAGEVFAIPADAVPLEVNLYGSATFPAGYSIPTAPQVGPLVPYVRLPADAPPK